MRVVIVGGGPAGLISALNLIQLGIRPIILEKKLGIRSTACGEACSLQSLDEIPFDSNPYIRKEVKGAKLVYADGAHSYMNKRSVILDRTAWLNGMAQEIEARGGLIRLGSELTAVGEYAIQLKDGERLDFEVLIGADGPKSRIAGHLGIKHQCILASQYKLACDTSNIEHLEFHIDKRFSPSYSWIFPKDDVINVGIEGDFNQLDAFLRHRKLDGYKIIKREVGVIPASGIQKIVQNNIALIGDAAGMTNPFSGNGLTPIICASKILARHIGNLQNYESAVKNHPIASPILLKTRQMLLKLADEDVTNLLSFLTGSHSIRSKSLDKITQQLSLLLTPKQLLLAYQAVRISRNYGW